MSGDLPPGVTQRDIDAVFDYEEDDADDVDGCLHGVPWDEECAYCDMIEDEADGL
jgi:hypothetical protein